MERDALDVEPPEQLRREVQSRRRRRGRAGRVGVDRLVARGVGEGLGDVRRQRGLPVRLAVEPHAPATLAQVLQQLERAVTVAGPEAARRPGERVPDAVPLVLEEQHLALRPLEPDPRRNDAGVVHDHELAGQLVRELGERSVPHQPRGTLVDEEPRGVAARRRVLRDQLRRQLVVELVRVHPTASVLSPHGRRRTRAGQGAHRRSSGRANGAGRAGGRPRALARADRGAGRVRRRAREHAAATDRRGRLATGCGPRSCPSRGTSRRSAG